MLNKLLVYLVPFLLPFVIYGIYLVLARKGKVVERKPRAVSVKGYEITRVELPEIDFVAHAASMGARAQKAGSIADLERLVGEAAGITLS